MTTELTTKESIRLGQAMNIVANKYAMDWEEKHVTWDCNAYREEVKSLYYVLADIEAEVVAKKNEKKPMEFPK